MAATFDFLCPKFWYLNTPQFCHGELILTILFCTNLLKQYEFTQNNKGKRPALHLTWFIILVQFLMKICSRAARMLQFFLILKNFSRKFQEILQHLARHFHLRFTFFSFFLRINIYISKKSKTENSWESRN